MSALVLLGGAGHSYEVTRAIAFPGFSRSAISSPDAGEFDAMVAGSYDFKHENWTFGPTLSLQYTYFSVNGVVETGAGSLNFSSAGWNTSSLISSLGGHAAYRWQIDKDLMAVPQLNLAWQHEFLQDPYVILGSLAGGPSFANWSAAPLRDTLAIGVGVTLLSRNNWSASFSYTALGGNQNLSSQNMLWSASLKF
ncbi:MAG: hypothetical protein B7Y12_07250 [Rhizobiales bacterium 24-66-13]|nr:MAG: hypothetical protein B7Y12_07250 [Rhizobiales bacterium 24-66-13]